MNKENLPKLPPSPSPYAEWKLKGKGWDNDGKETTYILHNTEDDFWSNPLNCIPSGADGTNYAELVEIKKTTILPTDSAKRKEFPMFTGLLKYFPNALAAVSHNSFLGGKKHAPDKPLQWMRELSSDHADCIVRHLTDSLDPNLDKVEELTQMAWRALALLQTEIEKQSCNSKQ